MKKINTRLMSGLLAVLFAAGLFASCNKPQTQPTKPAQGDKEKPAGEGTKGSEDKQGEKGEGQKAENKNIVIVGDSTELDDNMLGGWTNPSSNSVMREMVWGTASTQDTDLEGRNQINPNFAESIKQSEDKDGNVTFTIKIKKGNKFSDGSEITIDDYLAGILVFASNAIAEIDRYNIEGNAVLKGFEEWKKDNTKPFAGVRKLSDDTFSITILKDEIDYYVTDNASLTAIPKKVILPDVEIKDDGQGCYFSKEVTKETLNTIAAKDGYRYNPKVTPGAYMIEKYDSSKKSVTLKRNPYFPGNYKGIKPSIETIIIRYVPNDSILDQLKTGAIDYVGDLSGGPVIKQALQVFEDGKGKYKKIVYPRCGYGKINFQCDFGPTKFEKVRQAIAHLLDRQTFLAQYTGGYGVLVDGYYGQSMWEFEEHKDELANELNHYPYSVEEAKKLLEADGWTKDANGGAYKSGIRYKEVDGKLMPLEIHWLNTPSNPVSDLLNTMLPKTMEQAGMKLEPTTQDFKVLIKHLYRQGIDKPEYNMFNLGTGFTRGRQQPWYAYGTKKEYMGSYNTNYIADKKLEEAALKMKTSKDNTEWSKNWMLFQKEWNRALPDLPLYSDEYYTIFNAKIEDLKTSPQFSYGRALSIAKIANASK